MLHRFRQNIFGPIVVIWIVATAFGVLAHLLLLNRLAAQVSVSSESAQVGSKLQRLSSTLLEAESQLRLYLLAGNESSLLAFNKAESSVNAEMSDPALFSNGDPATEGQIHELKALLQQQLAEFQQLVELRRVKGLAAIGPIDTAGSAFNSRRILELITGINEKQEVLIARAAPVTLRRAGWAQFADFFTGFLGVGAGLSALYLVRLSHAQAQEARKLMAEKLRAERVAAEKSAFLANISHEIRTPMNAILGFGELLENEPLTPVQAQFVRSMQQSGKSLLQLINDVLDLSKLEAGKLEIHREPTDLQEICNFLQTIFGQQAAAKSLEIQFAIAGVPNALLLDRLRLRQVLVNLVGNSVKFTSQGHVCLRAEWTPEPAGRRGTLLLHVEDTGMGISPEKQGEIFEPFVQSDPAGTMETEGTGLGLHIVLRLVQIMGGSITLDSAPARGAVFHIRLPDVSVSSLLPVNDNPEVVGLIDFNDFAQANLLVVDDNATNLDLLAGIFERSHHTLRRARDGREALASIYQSKPDLILLDIRMPVMDGHALLAEIRNTPGLESLPVIAVTASSQESEEQLRGRFSGYIRKPFTRKALYMELALVLPRQSMARPDSPVPPVTAATARKGGDWNAMMIELRLLKDSSWAGLQHSIAINETRVFARKLHQLSQHAQCGPLETYADLLLAYAQNYAVRDLEKLLAEFPALLDKIGERSTLNSDV